MKHLLLLVLINFTFNAISFGQTNKNAQTEMLKLKEALKSACIKAISKDPEMNNVTTQCECYSGKHYEFAKKDTSSNLKQRTLEMRWAIRELDPKSPLVKENIKDPNGTIAEFDMNIVDECYDLYN